MLKQLIDSHKAERINKMKNVTTSNGAYECASTMNPLTTASEECAREILGDIRAITNDIDGISETIRTKIKGAVPSPCGENVPENPSLIDYLRLLRAQLGEIRETLVDANCSL